jgi:hypothetical protein
MRRLSLAFAVFAVACGKKDAPASGPSPAVTASIAPNSAAAAVPPGAPPSDGKYERVTVDGVTVPMIQVADHGATVLVDTEGTKPRTWKEQYRRKRTDLVNGQYDVHKTNANKNETFEDDAIDKEGLWVIDAKGNLSKR